MPGLWKQYHDFDTLPVALSSPVEVVHRSAYWIVYQTKSFAWIRARNCRLQLIAIVAEVDKGSLGALGYRRNVLHHPIDVGNGIHPWTIATSENSVYRSHHCYIYLVSKGTQKPYTD